MADYLYMLRMNASIISSQVLGLPLLDFPIIIQNPIKRHRHRRRYPRISRNVPVQIVPRPKAVMKKFIKPVFSLQLQNDFNLLTEE